MNAKGVAAVLAVVAVVAVGGAAAFVAGIGPLDDFADGGDDAAAGTPASTGTVYDDASGSGADGGEAGTADAGTGASAGADASDTRSLPPYTFAVQSIEECGRTCRDVTVRLDNNRDETATGVSVYTRIYAGNSTADGDKVWEGTRDVGTMEPGASARETSRVELSLSEGFRIQQADGWITIVTTVESDDVTITFKERRDVR
ncbi:hypothetical protein [Halobaculum lipolyticum]|uniref:Flagellin N-terminal-like domain-containing protein n=1 Tax=Halobaculum lipolyticum TaxID=3032001 RepID=A0ABD5W9V1_9EURY|nr:hypothetical protein [Halobaculum sp. DT31]